MLELVSDAVDRNYSKVPLTETEIRSIVKAAGGVDPIINLRHATARANGWKERLPTPTEFAKAAATENNLLRRPIIHNGTKAIFSRDLDEIRAFLAT